MNTSSRPMARGLDHDVTLAQHRRWCVVRECGRMGSSRRERRLPVAWQPARLYRRPSLDLRRDVSVAGRCAIDGGSPGQGAIMPEFILDVGTSAAAKRLADAGDFVTGYVEAAFFTSTGT